MTLSAWQIPWPFPAIIMSISYTTFARASVFVQPQLINNGVLATLLQRFLGSLALWPYTLYSLWKESISNNCHVSYIKLASRPSRRLIRNNLTSNQAPSGCGVLHFWGGLWAKLMPLVMFPLRPSTALLNSPFSLSVNCPKGLVAFSAPFG